MMLNENKNPKQMIEKNENVDNEIKSCGNNTTTMNDVIQERDNALQQVQEYEDKVHALLNAMVLIAKLTDKDCSNSSHTIPQHVHKTTPCSSSSSLNETSTNMTLLTYPNKSDHSHVASEFQQHIDYDQSHVSDKTSLSTSHQYTVGETTPPILNQATTYDKQNNKNRIVHGESSYYNSILSQLDNLQKHWKFEETSLPNILSGINRLQSHIVNLQLELDSTQPTIMSLNHDINKHKARNEKLSKVIKRLHKDNVILTNELKEEKDNKRKFLKSVKSYIKKKKEEEHVATRLNVHESMLRFNSFSQETSSSSNGTRLRQSMFQTKQPQNVGKMDSDSNLNENTTNNEGPHAQTNKEHSVSSIVIGANRIRTSTADSTFSDFSDLGSYRNYNYDFESNNEDANVSSNSIDMTTFINSDANVPSHTHADFDDTSSVSSWSTRSLVTDFSTPTVRIKSEPLLVDNKNHVTNGHTHDHILSKQNNKQPYLEDTYTIIFPCGYNICDKIEFIQCEVVSSTTSNRGRTSSENTTKTFDRQLSLGERIDNYFGFGPDSRTTKSTSELMFNERTDLPVINEDQSFTFLVSGFKNGDIDLDLKPRIHSRLIAIDGESVTDGDWTLEKIQTILSNYSTAERTLTFSNNTTLSDDAQKELLVKEQSTSSIMMNELIRESQNNSEAPPAKEKSSLFEKFKVQNTLNSSNDSAAPIKKQNSYIFSLGSMKKKESTTAIIDDKSNNLDGTDKDSSKENKFFRKFKV